MTALTTLVDDIAKAPDSDEKLAHLIGGLADRIKSTSNDQNVQRFARDLRAALPAIREALLSAPRP